VEKVQLAVAKQKSEFESEYHRYWEEMPCYLSVHDPDFRIIDGNRRFREDFGERIGQYCYEVYKGRDEICPNCPVEATFADGQNHPSEQLLTTKDGREVPVMVHTTAITDDSGDVVAVMEMHTDIGEVKRLQALLQRSQERLVQLFEEVPCFITVQGPDRVIQHANRRFRETFGDPVGEYCFKMYKHRDEQCLVCPMQQTFDDGEAREHEEVLFTKDGEKLSALCTTAPLRNSDGEVEAVIEMSIDITQIRELQSQLASIGLGWRHLHGQLRLRQGKAGADRKGLGDGAAQCGANPLHGARHPLLRQGSRTHC
jgi:PAS domain S-box-containing protein